MHTYFINFHQYLVVTIPKEIISSVKRKINSKVYLILHFPSHNAGTVPLHSGVYNNNTTPKKQPTKQKTPLTNSHQNTTEDNLYGLRLSQTLSGLTWH